MAPSLEWGLQRLCLPADSLSVPSGRSTVTHGGAAAPGCGQEPCSLLLLQGRAAADPAREERAQDQPVPGAGGAGLLPAVSPAAAVWGSKLGPSRPCSHPWPIRGCSWRSGGRFLCQALGWLTSWLLFARELLNEERVPSFFLDAMKSTIKRQRKKIRAKMLGTTEESASR